MRYAGLRFFNGEKSEINLVYNTTDEVFKGSVHLDEVSTGLYETATIFIIEEAVNAYGVSSMITPVGQFANSKFRLEFVNERSQSKDITLITAELADDGELYVNKPKSIELEPQSNTVVVSTTDGIHTVNSSATKEALQFTMGLHSETDAAHFRYLRIYDTADEHLVAEIYVYGETVGEDERLSILLSNFGATLTAKDQALFKDHDINEVGTDWKLINRKRKELLLEMSNIKPFVGTYKALINAIKFFGYNNLTLKEYWLMIDNRSPMFGKMKAIEVPSSASGFTAKKAQVVLPSSSYKKTSRFALFYKLNEADGNFDEWDTPTVQEVFDFTPDEVLIKLYGLKNKLQREYLPLHAKIIDIVGEGDFYSSYNTNFWNNQNPIAEVVAGIDASFEVAQDIIYIEDLQKVSSLLEGKNQDFGLLSPSDMADLYTDIQDFYDNYYNLDRSTFTSGNTDTIIGAPVQLNCTSFLSTWNDAQFTWDDAGSFITWLNWWKQNIYEVRWHITGPKGYSQTIEGGVDDYLSVALALPYAGSYSVTFEQIDLFNNVMVVRKPNAIEVKLKQLEVYGLYRWKDRDEYQWQGSNFKWDGAGGDWSFPQQNQDTVDKEIATLYMSLDRANYLHDDSKGVNFSMVRRYKDLSSSTGFGETTGPYFYRNLQEHTWNDGKHIWWDATRVGADLTASFKIIKARVGGILEIEHFNVSTGLTETGQHTFTVVLNNPLDLVSWQQGADELNNSTDPVISKFVYNPIYIDIDNDGIDDECLGILAVGKGYSSTFDFVTVDFDDPNNGIVEGRINYKSYNPTYNDVRVIEDHAEVELLTHLTFSADKSKMPGKQSYNWKLRNNSQNGDDIYYNSKWLTYLFNKKGDYTLELEVQDINGNVNKLTKNVLTIK